MTRDKPISEEVTQLYSRVFARFMHGWNVIQSFRHVGLAGIPLAEQVVAAEHEMAINHMAETGQLDRLINGIKDEHDRRRIGSTIRKGLTEQSLRIAALSVDAASIVFAHSVLDESLSDLLEVASLLAPEFWEERLESKKADLIEVKSKGYDEILKIKISDEIRRLKRNTSIIKKTKTLHAICKRAASGPTGYEFDPELLQELDTLRQDIVHGELLGTEISHAQEKLEFLKNANLYFIVLLNDTFAVQMDPTIVFKQPARKRS